MRKASFHVAPVYTCGSPAMVDELTANQVAREERNAYYRYYLERLLGSEEADRAKQRGLDRIVYSVMEIGKKIHVYDVITGKNFEVPTKEWTGNYWYKRQDYMKFHTRTDALDLELESPPFPVNRRV